MALHLHKLDGEVPTTSLLGAHDECVHVCSWKSTIPWPPKCSLWFFSFLGPRDGQNCLNYRRNHLKKRRSKHFTPKAQNVSIRIPKTFLRDIISCCKARAVVSVAKQPEECKCMETGARGPDLGHRMEGLNAERGSVWDADNSTRW